MSQQSNITEKHPPVINKPIGKLIEEKVRKYFNELGQQPAAEIYEVILAEVEKPLLTAMMEYTRGNQSKAAVMLGLSRGTLRKKLKVYGFI